MDCGGVLVDLCTGRRPTQLPTYAMVDTPCGPGLYFNNSGEARFAQTPQHSHADTLATATTGEFSAYGRYFHVANGAAYNSLIRANLSAAPYSQWGAEADSSGASLTAYARSTSGARPGTPSGAHGFAAGSEHSIAMTSSVSAQTLTLYADATALRTTTLTSHYFDPAAGYFQLGAGVRGSIYIAAFWHRAVTKDEMAALDANPWFGLLPERRVFYADMGAGGGVTGTASITLDDVTVSASGTVAAGPITGTGAVTLDDATVSGSGAVLSPITGDGAVTLDGVTVSGTGSATQPITGTGSVALDGATVAGAGSVTDPITGTGAVTLDGVTLAATGGSVAPAVIGGGQLITIDMRPFAKTIDMRPFAATVRMRPYTRTIRMH